MGRRISIIHYSAPPVIGGVEFIIKKHSELIRKNEVDVQIIAGVGDADILIPELEASHYEDIQSSILNGQEPDEFSDEVKKLRSKLKDVISSSDAVIVHNIFTMHFNLVATAALAHIAENMRVIAWVHDIAYIDSTYSLPEPDIGSLEFISRPHDKIEYVTITGYRKEKLIDFMGIKESRVKVIPNGIDPYMPLPQEMKEVAEELDIMSYYPVVIYPSRLTRRKNFEKAIEIVGELKGNPLLLLSAPPDPHNPAFSSYKSELKEMADRLSANVLFLGEYCRIEDIYPFYFLGDVLLITSRMEGFGLPALEASLMRMPGVLSDIPPLRELGRDLENVMFFGLHEFPADIAYRMDSFIRSKKTVKDRREIINRYSWDKIYKEYLVPLLELS